LISVTVKGSFKKTEGLCLRIKNREQFKALARYGQVGVSALERATPVDSGDTAHSWYYEIVDRPGYFAIHWYNSHVRDGIPVAVLIQYGHATRRGGYVQARDFINPAMRHIFEEMANDMWKVVTK
jgi:hypothetical protein